VSRRRTVATGGAFVVGFLVVGIATTALLDPYVWPSLVVGIPAGIVAGVVAALAVRLSS
jgi:ABC-type uncharacterized transport system permease subunit